MKRGEMQRHVMSEWVTEVAKVPELATSVRNAEVKSRCE